MKTIVLETYIDAPQDVCFDASIDVDVHKESTRHTGERIVAGVSTGMMKLGDTVTFEARHFGVVMRLTSRIAECERPRRFVDEMVKGAFASLRHVHEFFPDGPTVLMRDTLTWRSPFGFLGVIADKLFVESHMRSFMVTKQEELKAYAERSHG